MIRSLSEGQFASKRGLVRVDWNMPLDDRGRIVDDFRMRASLPTIDYLEKHDAGQLFFLTHLGNPVVRPGEQLERTMMGNRSLWLAPIAKHFARLRDIPVESVELVELPDSPLPAYRVGPYFLLENLRFHPGEMAVERSFAQALAHLGDFYINEAFSESHRTVASLVYPPALLPAYAGLRLTEELSQLSQLTKDSEHPVVFVLGGAKVLDKLAMIETLIKHVDYFLVGGVMANTFLAAQGIDMKQSVVERDRMTLAKELLNRAPQKFILPLDFVWERDRALDIGPQTVALFERHIAKARWIFWNGPLGWTDGGRERFRRGTDQIARAIADSEATSIVSGGDTTAVIDQLSLGGRYAFLSTGGGATLQFLSGADLPGIRALLRSH